MSNGQGQGNHVMLEKQNLLFSVDAGVEFDQVILSLATVGMLQLQLTEAQIKENPHLSRLESFLDEIYCEAGQLLQGQTHSLSAKSQVSSSSQSASVFLSQNTQTKLSQIKRLRSIVNTVKLAAARSKDIANKLDFSSYLSLLFKIEDAFLCCPWVSESESSNPDRVTQCTFVWDCPLDPDFAHKLINDDQIEKAILTLTLLKLGDQFFKPDTAPAFLKQVEDGKMLFEPHSIWNTDLVLKLIMEMLPVQALLRVRSVNTKFKSHALKILQGHNRKSLRIEFDYDQSTSEYFWPKLVRGVYTIVKLTEFNNFIRSHPYAYDFPCTNFSFNNGTLQPQDLQLFLNLFGPRIHKLSINLFYQLDHLMCPSYCPPATQLTDLLVRQAPNIHTLVLTGFLESWIYPYSAADATLLFTGGNVNHKLRNLKTLIFNTEPAPSMVCELLAAADNLQEIHSVDHIEPFIQMKKCHLVKEFLLQKIVGPFSAEEYTEVNKGLDISPMFNLKTFGIFCPRFDPNEPAPPVVTDALTRIIAQCAKTLKTFHVMPHLSYFPAIHFPVLPRVRELIFNSRPKHKFSHQNIILRVPLFPPGAIPGIIFPNLHKITIGFINDNRIILNWDECFGNIFDCHRLVNVRFLEVEQFRDLPSGWMENLARIAPFVENIDIQTILYNFPADAVNGLWKFKNLKSLKLKINVWRTENAFPTLDSVFTGFSRETCIHLLNAKEEDGVASVQDLRVHQSLMDLKDLTRLQVGFVDLCPGRARTLPIITKLTGLYAFQMCTNLTVCFEAEGLKTECALKLMDALEPLFPFVHLHIPKNWPTKYLKNYDTVAPPNEYNCFQ